MLDQLALNMALFFSKQHVYISNQVPVYKYGFEVFLSSVLNLMVLFIVAAFTHTLGGAILFCLAFIPLRCVVGGYHAKHHWSCIFSFNSIYLSFVVITTFLEGVVYPCYFVSAMVVSILLVWKFAPVEAQNKPLKAGHYRAQRRKSRKLICGIGVIVAFVYGLLSLQLVPDCTKWLTFYVSGIAAASFTLLVSKIAK